MSIRNPEEITSEMFDLAFGQGEALLKGTLTGPPTADQLQVQRDLVGNFTNLYAEMVTTLQGSRHLSLALTALEQAKMYAVAAIFD